MDKYRKSGFTLVELSIVLVIIGLVLGVVVGGRDLIEAARIRSVVRQVTQYNTAVNTFRNKYGGLPGDLSATSASQFGFVSRAGTQGRGDGNGVMEGYSYPASTVYDWDIAGEPAFFWTDLSMAGLIDGRFASATDSALPGLITFSTHPTIGNYFPVTKISNVLFFYVFSTNDQNYFALTTTAGINPTGYISNTDGGLTVSQASDIDNKLDDGMPTTGNVQPFYPSGTGGGFTSGNAGVAWAPNAATATSSTCFDTTTGFYSITQNNGTGFNCGLSFKFQ